MPVFTFKIRNIKGYGDVPTPIVLNLDHKKVNFVVAPNGGGKSSFVAAFSCLDNGRINVPKELKYRKQDWAASSLSVDVDGSVWIANGRSNKISAEWNPFIINTRVFTEVVAAVGPRGGMLNEPVTKVQSVKVADVVPSVQMPYNFANIQAGFGRKSGALKDFSAQINTVDFLMAVKETLPLLYQFNYYAKARNRVSELVNVINGKPGYVRSIKSKMTDADFKTIEQYKNYKIFKQAFSKIIGSGSHKLDFFLLFYQLLQVYSANTVAVKACIAWAEYELLKRQISMDLQCVKCPWKEAVLSERNNSLFIDYPLADEYSNGQRDIMTIYSQLLLFKIKIQDNKKYLLILDEVFDYLDDGNLLAAQYFLSDLLDKTNHSNVYTILFSHLDPTYYRTYVLKKMLNVVHLHPQTPIPNTLTKCFIGYREWLKQQIGDVAKTQLYRDLSNKIFHYNPVDCNYRAQILANQHPNHAARVTWGEKRVFYTYLIDEVNNYLNGLQYDPYAVAFSIRIRIEKMAYSQINDAGLKQQFIDTDETFPKIEFCENNGIHVPVFYMMVLAIGNEASHLKCLAGGYEEKEIVYKLKNNTVKRIIEHLFNKVDNQHVSLNTIYL